MEPKWVGCFSKAGVCSLLTPGKVEGTGWKMGREGRERERDWEFMTSSWNVTLGKRDKTNRNFPAVAPHTHLCSGQVLCDECKKAPSIALWLVKEGWTQKLYPEHPAKGSLAESNSQLRSYARETLSIKFTWFWPEPTPWSKWQGSDCVSRRPCCWWRTCLIYEPAHLSVPKPHQGQLSTWTLCFPHQC